MLPVKRGIVWRSKFENLIKHELSYLVPLTSELTYLPGMKDFV